MNQHDPTSSSVAPPAETPPSRASGQASPGALIRSAREAQNMSVDDLAGATKLTRQTIEAMEIDDFASLLEPVYVRGYYRKCAKVLGVDEKKLVDAYSSRVVIKSPLPPARLRLASGGDLGTGTRLPMTAAVVVAIGALGFCAFLWFVRGTTTHQPAGVPGPAEVAVTPAETMAPPPAVSAPAPAAEAAPAAAPPSEAPASAPAPSSAAGASLPSAAAPASATAAPVSGALQLRFADKSWVLITDVTGKTLQRGLMAAGDHIGLDGTAPFKLVIGNSGTVSVQYAGQAIDLKPYTRADSTARLRVQADGKVSALQSAKPPAEAAPATPAQ